MSLDFTPEEFRALLYRASDAVLDLYRTLDDARVFHAKSPGEIRALFDEPLPQDPVAPAAVIDRFSRDVVGSSTLNISPNFYGYVISAGNEMAVVVALLQAGANLCGSKWDLSAASAEIERKVVEWVAEFIGFGLPVDGVLTGGGTTANLIGLIAARNAVAMTQAKRGGPSGTRRMALYTSNEAHSCFERNLDLIGIGADAVHSIPTDGEFRIDCAELERRIEADRDAGVVPLCVVGNAGTVNTGAVDDLVELARICKAHDIWFHVDAAYGGPAAATDIVGSRFQGLRLADSIALDPHKWLYVPISCGLAMLRDPGRLEGAFRRVPAYLRSSAEQDDEGERLDWYTKTYQTTRDTKAFRVWATLLAYGAKRLRSEIENNIRSMRYLGEMIAESKDFELVAPVELSTVCFRYVSDDETVQTDEARLDRINRALLAAIERDGRVFVPGTTVRGQTVLRACTVNHRHTPRHGAYLLDTVREIAAAVMRSPAGFETAN